MIGTSVGDQPMDFCRPLSQRENVPMTRIPAEARATARIAASAFTLPIS